MRLGAVLLVEGVGLVEMRGLDQRQAALLGQALAQQVADAVVDAVAQDGGAGEQQEDQRQTERAGGREGAGGEQQGVAGQERRHHQPGLAEDDPEQDQIGPGAVVPDDLQRGVCRGGGRSRG